MTILIFGGTKGIGRALASLLADDTQVVIAGRSEPENLDLPFVQCDVSDHEAVRDAIAYTVNTYGGLDVVVNSAGYGHCKSIDEISIEEWDRMNRVTVDGNFYIAKYAYEVFSKQKSGHYLIVGSMASGGGWAKEIGYGTFKGAQAKFAMHLMDQFDSDNRTRGANLHCHVVCPGSVYTEFWDNIPERSIRAEDSLSPVDVAGLIKRVIDEPELTYSDLAGSRSADAIDIGPLPPFEQVDRIIKIAHNAHP